MADRNLQIKILTQLQDKLSGPLRQITGASGAAGKEMRELRAKLKDLEQTQKVIGQFRELSSKTRDTAAAMQAAQGRVADLARQMAAADKPSAKLRGEFTRATAESRKLKTAHTEQTHKLQEMRDKLSAAGISTSKLGGSERDLRSNIRQTNEQLEQQKTRLGQVAQQQRRLTEARERYSKAQQLASSMAVSGAAALATGSGALYAGARFMAPGIQFDSDMSQVQALMRLERDSAQLAALRAQARQLGADTMFSATDAAQGQGYLAMAGFSPQAILDAMPGLLDMAKAGGNELAETADIASNILTGFNIQASEMGRVGDVLVGAFTRSNTNLAMLGETMKYAAPIASSLGQDIETVAAMAGKLGDAGIQGGMGGTALRAILNRLSSPPKAAASALEELGISASTADGNLRPMPELLQEIYERTKDLGDTERAGLLKGLAGSQAVSALQILVQQAGTGELQKFIGVLRETQGEAAKTAAIMGDNLVGDLDELSSAWEDLAIQLQEQQDGVLRGTVVMLADIVGGVKNWIAANPQLTGTLVKAAAIMAVVIAAGGAITLALASIIGPLAMVRYGFAILGIRGGGLLRMLSALGSTVLPLVGKGLLFIGRALLMNPIGLAVTAIAGAAILIYKYWEPISEFFSGLWDKIAAVFKTALEAILAFMTGWWGNITAKFTDALDGIKSIVANAGTQLIDAFKNIGSQIMDGLIGGIKAKTGALKDSVTGMGSNAVGWFKDKLGIHSPSRVFMDLGGFVSEGAARGIQGKQRLLERAAQAMTATVLAAGGLSPAVAGIVQPPAIAFDPRPPIAATLSRAVAAPAAAAGAMASLGGDHIEIHIHAAPSQSAQDIAAAVRAELERRDRDRAARRRSSLSDYGA